MFFLLVSGIALIRKHSLDAGYYVKSRVNKVSKKYIYVEYLDQNLEAKNTSLPITAKMCKTITRGSDLVINVSFYGIYSKYHLCDCAFENLSFKKHYTKEDVEELCSK